MAAVESILRIMKMFGIQRQSCYNVGFDVGEPKLRKEITGLPAVQFFQKRKKANGNQKMVQK